MLFLCNGLLRSLTLQHLVVLRVHSAASDISYSRSYKLYSLLLKLVFTYGDHWQSSCFEGECTFISINE